jgi:RsiW-degrading membrane proteinase PrsW (M82 family)
MWILLLSAIAPAIMLMLFIYIRDRYEMEPWKMVIKVFLGGLVVAYPTFLVESYINPLDNGTIYHSFMVSGFTEEFVKYAVTLLLVYRNREFNETFDGIVYAVASSLGFATLENILYVMPSGFETAAVRALLPVSAHALFAIAMGYFLGIAKFAKKRSYRFCFLIAAIVIPSAAHGVYDSLLLSGYRWIELLVIPFMILMWISAWRFMRSAESKSPFKPNLPIRDDLSV